MEDKKVRCLITGGSGFQGSHLTKALLAKGYSVRCLDRYKPTRKAEGDFEFVEGDFSATHLIADAIRGCDVIFHLACTTLPQTSNEDPDFDVSSNVLGTIRMLDEAVKAKVKRFIFISSGGTVYGIPSMVPIPESHPTNPTCSYGITKLTIEKYLRLYWNLHGLSSCSVRLANPYGENQRFDSIQGVIAAFCHKAIHDQNIQIWGDGSVRRDFIYIDDVIEALVKLIDAPIVGCEVNIGSGKASSINEIIRYIELATGKPTRHQYLPARPFDVPVSELDVSYARTSLDWSPKVSIFEGISRTISWMKQSVRQD